MKWQWLKDKKGKKSENRTKKGRAEGLRLSEDLSVE